MFDVCNSLFFCKKKENKKFWFHITFDLFLIPCIVLKLWSYYVLNTINSIHKQNISRTAFYNFFPFLVILVGFGWCICAYVHYILRRLLLYWIRHKYFQIISSHNIDYMILLFFQQLVFVFQKHFGRVQMKVFNSTLNDAVSLVFLFFCFFLLVLL